MDFTKLVLPDTVEVSGRYFKIHTGHPWWFRFAQIIEQDKIYLRDFDHLYVDDVPEDKQAGVDALAEFFYEKKEVPRSFDEPGDRILDYDIDADYLYAGILQQYGVDLFEKELHWHKVRAMISGLHGTMLNEIMSYRCAKDSKNTELMRMKRIWALPEKVSEEEKENIAAFHAQFK